MSRPTATRTKPFRQALSLFGRSPARTILVIDDDALVLDVTRSFLDQRGLKAITAQDATHALERLDEGGVDAVLLDIHMPHQDGIALLPKLRALYPSVPVIMLTGDGYPVEVMERCADLGAAGFVSKHTELENVLVAVRRAMGRGAARGEGSDPVRRAFGSP